MTNKVRTMLEGMYDAINEEFNDPIKTWDNLIDFIATDYSGALLTQLNHKFEWYFNDNQLSDAITGIYDPDLLKSEYYDHLGEMYHEKVLAGHKTGKYLMSGKASEKLVESLVSETDKEVRIIDPTVGSGRLLMAAHKIAPNAVLYGIDFDQRLIRIAFTNMAIHGITAYLLNANRMHHETDISKENGRYNWQYANRWYSCIDKLKPREYQKPLSKTTKLPNSKRRKFS